jgi:glutamate-1-semialdehyde 2,1-aminomutase
MEVQESSALFGRLEKLLPGGNTRTASFYSPFPLALDRGLGYSVWDVDGNEYIDLVNNYSSLVHGHAHPVITDAICRASACGTVMSAPMRLHAELADRIKARFPSIQLLRYTNSGTEAVMMAVRAARAFTGREAIVKATGGFHGSWEQVSGAATGVAAGPQAKGAERRTGIPHAVAQLALTVPFNDVPSLEAAMAKRGHEVAAIILEPVLGQLIEPATQEYVEAARRLADKYDALFILDELVTARLDWGGSQGKLGIRPDLTTLGKIIGGGLPVGAFGGREDVMSVFDPRRLDSIEHPGTFNGNTLAMAAGCASLDLLPQSEIDRINGLGERLAIKLQSIFEAHDLGFWASSVGSLLHVHCACMRELHAACLREGLYIAPRGLLNISTPMDEDVIERAALAMERAIVRLRCESADFAHSLETASVRSD